MFGPRSGLESRDEDADEEEDVLCLISSSCFSIMGGSLYTGGVRRLYPKQDLESGILSEVMRHMNAFCAISFLFELSMDTGNF